MPQRINLKVNGEDREVEAPARRLLVDLLRYDLGLTGTKEGCSVGVCGACTVLVDGEMVASCITLAAAVAGSEITTIEGLAQDGRLHPVQQAFIDYGGFQCGICTPGQVMAAKALLDENCRTHRGRDSRLDDGQPVPLHRVLQDPGVSGGRHEPRQLKRGGARQPMIDFEFHQANDLDHALCPAG